MGPWTASGLRAGSAISGRRFARMERLRERDSRAATRTVTIAGQLAMAGTSAGTDRRADVRGPRAGDEPGYDQYAWDGLDGDINVFARCASSDARGDSRSDEHGATLEPFADVRPELGFLPRARSMDARCADPERIERDLQDIMGTNFPASGDAERRACTGSGTRGHAAAWTSNFSRSTI